MKSNAMKVLMPAFVVSIMLAAGFAAVLVPAGDSDGCAAPAEEYDIVWKLRNVTVEDDEKVDKVGYGFSFTPICNEGYKDMTVTIKINGVVATWIQRYAMASDRTITNTMMEPTTFPVWTAP